MRYISLNFVIALVVIVATGAGLIYKLQESASEMALLPLPLAQVASYNLDQGLALYWKLDEGTGSTVTDSSGNGMNGTLLGSPTWVSGSTAKINGALSFNGTNSAVTSPAVPLNTAVVSVAFWLNGGMGSGTSMILESSPNLNNSDTGFAVSTESSSTNCPGASNIVWLVLHGNMGYNNSCFQYPGSGWHHYVAVFDKSQGSQREVSLFIDGATSSVLVQHNSADNTNGFNASPANPIYLMSRGGSSLFSSGTIDDVRIYTKALSQAEAQALYNWTPAPPPPPADTSAPSIPASISANVVSANQINLSWSASTDNVGVTGYKVFRGGVQIGTTAQTSYGDTGLSPSTSYTYSVSAYDAAGNNSGQSSAISATTAVQPDTTVPVISVLSSSGITTSSASISWMTDENATSQVDYGLTTSYGSQTPLNSALSTSHSVSLSGLSSNTTYHFRVSSADAAGNLAQSSDQTFTTAVQAQTLDTTAPSTPMGLSATALSSSQIRLTWNASTDNVGVAGYDIYDCRGNSCKKLNALTKVSGTTYQVNSLSAGTTYRFAIDAFDAAGNLSGKTGTVSVATPSVAPPTYTLSVTKSGAGSGTVSGGGINCGATCSATITGGTPITLTATPASGSSFAGWSGACNGTASSCALTINANTAVSATFSIAADTSAPSIPASISANVVSANQINLSWSASTDNVGVTGYKVFRGGVQIGTTAQTSYGDTGLSPSTSYTYSVSAYDAAGNNSGQSASVTATTQPLSSTKFQLNDRVTVSSGPLNVRATPSISATLVGTQNTGALGTIIGGTIYADGYFWWNVNFDTGADGWSVEDYLSGYTPPTTYVLSVSTAGSGTGSITCGGGACPTSVTSGTSVTLTATPASGSSFAGWSGACTGTASTCTLTVVGNTTVSATFNLVSTNKFNIGDRVEITNVAPPARANIWATAAVVTLVGTQPAGASGTIIGGPTSAGGTTWYQVDFDNSTIDGWDGQEYFGTYIPVALTVTRLGSGTVTSNPGGINCGATCSANFGIGSQVVLTAAPTTGYYVSSWSGACSGNALACTVLMDSGQSTTIYFALDSTPPSTPTNLSASAFSANQINLSWSASTDNVAVTGYKVFRNGVQIDTTAQTSYSDTGLSPNTSYTYTVSAYDAVGNNSAPSSVASATTKTQSGFLLPPDRSANPVSGTPWSGAGVPGGIPVRTTICATLGTAGGTIATPQSVTISQINSALSACPAGQVVYLNPGTYSLVGSTPIRLGNNSVTLRGAGPDKTYLKFSGNFDTELVQIGKAYGQADPPGGPGTLTVANWITGFGQGTTQITLDKTTGLSVGQVMCLDQHAGGSSPWSSPVTLTGDNRTGIGLQQCVLVTAINGTSITISPGIYGTLWNSSLSPQAWWWGSNKSLQTDFSGIEDLKLDGTGSGSQYLVRFVGGYANWMKNVESMNPYQHNVEVSYSKSIEIRDSYFHDAQNLQSNNYANDVGDNTSSDVLVENNIFTNIPNMIDARSTSGSVFAYNYGVKFPYYISTWLPETMMTHGGHPFMDLFEGNEGPNIVFDEIYDPASHIVVFRNRLLGSDPGKTGSLNPLYVASNNNYVSIIDNVLGTAGVQGSYNGYNLTTGGSQNIYNFVYQSGDPLVPPTLTRWGNYDTFTGTIKMQTDEAGGVSLPSDLTPYKSLYRSSAPSWWNSSKLPNPNLPWPAIGSDITGGTGPQGHSYDIPAKQCFTKLNLASGGAYNANLCY